MLPRLHTRRDIKQNLCGRTTTLTRHTRHPPADRPTHKLIAVLLLPLLLLLLAGRDIKQEALQQVAGSNYAARREALRYGTPLNCELFALQSKLLREAAKAFLDSPQCENSSEALPAYLRGLGKGGGGWFFEEALWNAMYGVNCHVRRNVAAEAGRQRRLQQQEEARRQREQARRQRYEQARQQHRQQQYQQARQQRSVAPSDLAAAVPDVSNMSEVQLETFLRAVST
jgi:hypothetical protein